MTLGLICINLKGQSNNIQIEFSGVDLVNCGDSGIIKSLELQLTLTNLSDKEVAEPYFYGDSKFLINIPFMDTSFIAYLGLVFLNARDIEPKKDILINLRLDRSDSEYFSQRANSDSDIKNKVKGINIFQLTNSITCINIAKTELFRIGKKSFYNCSNFYEFFWNDL
jgi:hypothetical protein